MADYRDERGTTYVERRGSGTGKIVLAAVAVIAIIVAVLFATGFWSADVKEGAMPEVKVSGGEMPKVDLDSKEVVVGTKETTVDVPKVTTEKKAIDVPVVGVKDN